jgi:glucose/arabinose dehydrogenase
VHEHHHGTFTYAARRRRRPAPRVALLAIGAVLGLSACGSGSTSIGAGLRGAKGVTATVYATGVVHASAFALDARGRLWVAASGATTHRGDGVYLVHRKGANPQKVVSGLTAPLGLVWSDGTLYVASLGAVHAYSGFDGTRFARSRLILDGPVKGGENNNLVLARDGRLLMGVSASCDHCVPASRYSAAIVSFNKDGNGLRVYARRIRAPFGLALDPATGDLYASMNQRDDLGSKTPGDWLAVVDAGSDWGFPGCYGQGGTACAHVPTPLAILDPHAAAGGVALLGGTALVAEWQLGKLIAVSTATGKTKVLVTGLESPLPLLRLGDGSVLLGDWRSGTIYRLAFSPAS